MKLSVSLKDSDFGWIITKFERTLVAGHYLFYNGQSYRVDRVQFDENGNQDVIVSESAEPITFQ